MMLTLRYNKKHQSICVSLLMLAIALNSCKKSKVVEDPSTLPVITTMQYRNDQFITSKLGRPNDTIKINGHRFSQDFKESTVQFNDLTATAVWGDSTQIWVAVPDALPAGTVKLTINTNGRSVKHNTVFNVDPPLPQATKLNVTSGMRGSKLILYGQDFSTTRTNNLVTINGITAVVDSAERNAIYLNVPANGTSGKVALITHGKTLTYSQEYTIVSSTFTIVNNLNLQNITFDANGNMYGTIDNKVIKTTPGGVQSTLAVIANSGTYLSGCVADAAGTVYVCTPFNNTYKNWYNTGKVYKVLPDGTVSTFAGDYPGYADGQGTAALFTRPSKLAIDKSSNIYVTDQNKIRKITSSGLVSTFAGNNSNSATPVDGQGTAARFTGIRALTVDPLTGNLYVLDGSSGAMLRRITPNGVVSTIMLTAQLGGTAVPNSFDAHDMVIDVSGNIYIHNGRSIYSIKNGVMTDAYLNPSVGNIWGIGIDGANNIYISAYTDITYPFVANPYATFKITP